MHGVIHGKVHQIHAAQAVQGDGVFLLQPCHDPLGRLETADTAAVCGGGRHTHHQAQVEWGTEDPRVTDETEFIVEFRKRPIMLGDTVVLTPAELKWQELGRTKDRKLAKDIFLLDSTYELRIRADVTKEMAE